MESKLKRDTALIIFQCMFVICLQATYTKAGFYVNTKTEALLELSRETNRLFSEITCIKISTNFS